MAHLNELQEEFGDAGLVVVGVTNEDAELVDAVAKKSGMEYTLARVAGSGADRDYGVRGFPTALLIDREGRVAWQGHPGLLASEDVARLLEP